MPKKLPKNEAITFKTNADTLERLNRLAEKTDIPRSKLIADIVEEATLSLDAPDKIRSAKPDETNISFNCPNDILNLLNKLSKKADIDRSRLIVNILRETSITLDSCGKVGILQFMILMRNLSDKMGEWAVNLKAKKIDI